MLKTWRSSSRVNIRVEKACGPADLCYKQFHFHPSRLHAPYAKRINAFMASGIKKQIRPLTASEIKNIICKRGHPIIPCSTPYQDEIAPAQDDGAYLHPLFNSGPRSRR